VREELETHEGVILSLFGDRRVEMLRVVKERDEKGVMAVWGTFGKTDN